MYVCVLFCMPDAHRGQKKVFNPLELELQRNVATKWVLGIEPRFWKNNQCSLLSHISSLLFQILFLFVLVSL